MSKEKKSEENKVPLNIEGTVYNVHIKVAESVQKLNQYLYQVSQFNKALSTHGKLLMKTVQKIIAKLEQTEQDTETKQNIEELKKLFVMKLEELIEIYEKEEKERANSQKEENV